MEWITIIIFILLCSGLLTIFDFRFNEIVQVVSKRKEPNLKEELDTLLGTPPKGFFKTENMEIKQLLKATGRDGKFEFIKKSSLFLFGLGGVIAFSLGNIYMIPVLAVGFSMVPMWYIRSTSNTYKKHLNDELETAISIITTSYLRTDNLLVAIKENTPFINVPVKSTFEDFIAETEMIHANTISAINSMKMKIRNQIFHEWCNGLIQCQSDRMMKGTLVGIVQKFSDIRIVQSELDAIICAPKREAFTMIGLVVFNIPLLYLLNKEWYQTLIYTTPGQITMAICGAIIVYALIKIMQLSKPMEYNN